MDVPQIIMIIILTAILTTACVKAAEDGELIYVGIVLSIEFALISLLWWGGFF